METIGKSNLFTFLDGSKEASRASNNLIRQGKGYFISSYLDLANKLAELQFRNHEHVLLYRGQSRDVKNSKGNTSLKPTILRGGIGAANPDSSELASRFSSLNKAERELVRAYEAERELLGRDRVRRQRITRWSILQHYEICDTPLLDVTHSIRVAASFASHRAQGEAFIFVVGVPHLSGAVTASADAGLQIARLASMCPPDAMRPHIQEGYLLGEYPELGEYEQKALYAHYEVDFGRRLVAKFRFDPDSFWNDSKGFPLLSEETLSPASHSDPFAKVAKRIKATLKGSN